MAILVAKKHIQGGVTVCRSLVVCSICMRSELCELSKDVIDTTVSRWQHSVVSHKFYFHGDLHACPSGRSRAYPRMSADHIFSRAPSHPISYREHAPQPRNQPQEIKPDPSSVVIQINLPASIHSEPMLHVYQTGRSRGSATSRVNTVLLAYLSHRTLKLASLSAVANTDVDLPSLVLCVHTQPVLKSLVTLHVA